MVIFIHSAQSNEKHVCGGISKREWQNDGRGGGWANSICSHKRRKLSLRMPKSVLFPLHKHIQTVRFRKWNIRTMKEDERPHTKSSSYETILRTFARLHLNILHIPCVYTFIVIYSRCLQLLSIFFSFSLFVEMMVFRNYHVPILPSVTFSLWYCKDMTWLKPNMRAPRGKSTDSIIQMLRFETKFDDTNR